MVKKQLIDFYAKYGTYNDEVFNYGDYVVFKSLTINDPIVNRVLVVDDFDLARAEQLIAKHALPLCNIELTDKSQATKLTSDYKFIEETSFLHVADISKFRKMPAHPNIEMIRLCTPEDFDLYKQVSLLGFMTPSTESPYGIYDDASYCDFLKIKVTKQKEEIIRSFTFRFKDTGEYFSCIDVAKHGDIGYISNFVIIPKYRRTSAFLCLVPFVEYLKQQGIKQIFCSTVAGGYPEGLYQNLGFKKIFTACQYRKNMVK